MSSHDILQVGYSYKFPKMWFALECHAQNADHVKWVICGSLRWSIAPMIGTYWNGDPVGITSDHSAAVEIYTFSSLIYLFFQWRLFIANGCKLPKWSEGTALSSDAQNLAVSASWKRLNISQPVFHWMLSEITNIWMSGVHRRILYIEYIYMYYM